MRYDSASHLFDRHAIVTQHLPACAGERVRQGGFPAPAFARQEPGAPIPRNDPGGVNMEAPELAQSQDLSESRELSLRNGRSAIVASPRCQPPLPEMKLRALFRVHQ